MEFLGAEFDFCSKKDIFWLETVPSYEWIIASSVAVFKGLRMYIVTNKYKPEIGVHTLKKFVFT